MKHLYFFIYTFVLLFSSPASFSQNFSNSHINKKTILNSTEVLPSKNKNFFISSITNQNQVIHNNNKADIFLNKALEDFKKADKYLSKAKKDYRKGQKSLRKANLFYKRGSSSLALTRVESKKANKILDESFNDYRKGLEYLSDALDSYEVYLKEIRPKFNLIQ